MNMSYNKTNSNKSKYIKSCITVMQSLNHKSTCNAFNETVAVTKLLREVVTMRTKL